MAPTGTVLDRLILTSVEFDHADIYRDLDEIKTADGGSAQALSSELSGLMSELQKLYGQALDRVAELKKG